MSAQLTPQIGRADPGEQQCADDIGIALILQMLGTAVNLDAEFELAQGVLVDT